ncbi:hypothetical protein GQ457_04G037760 [Hibiscus cannabinus]
MVQLVNGLVVVIKEWLLRSWDVQVNHTFRHSNMVTDLVKALRDHTVSTMFFRSHRMGFVHCSSLICKTDMSHTID